MVDFIEKHWDLINWPTAFIAVAVLTPIAVILFKLIASHAQAEAKAATESRDQAISERDAMQGERDAALEENESLKSRVESRSRRDSWKDVELNEEEQTVLICISSDRMSELIRSKKISSQRISLAQDRLSKTGLAGWGTMGMYASEKGREWLNAKGLLK